MIELIKKLSVIRSMYYIEEIKELKYFIDISENRVSFSVYNSIERSYVYTFVLSRKLIPVNFSSIGRRSDKNTTIMHRKFNKNGIKYLNNIYTYNPTPEELFSTELIMPIYIFKMYKIWLDLESIMCDYIFEIMDNFVVDLQVFHSMVK